MVRRFWRLAACTGLVLCATTWLAHAAPPPNDNCSIPSGAPNPLLPILQLGVPVAGTTVDATTDPLNFLNATGSCWNTYFDVFYAFTPLTTGAFTFKVCSADGTFRPNLAVYDTTIDLPTGDTIIGCFNQSYTIGGCPTAAADCTFGRSVVSYLEAGRTYYIGVGNSARTGSNLRGNFTVVATAGGGAGACTFPSDPDTCIILSRPACEDAFGGEYGGDGTTCTAPPPTPRDLCTDAVELPVGQAISSSNDFVNALQDNISTLFGRKDMFVKFTPSATGAYRFSTCGSDFDTVLSVHTACPATWVNQLVANDNSPVCASGTASSVVLELSAGTTYFVRIAGPSTAITGTISVRVDPDNTSSLGACCLIDGSCIQTEAAACEGVMSAPGTTCATAACVPAVGACCTPGICVVSSRLDCQFSRSPNYSAATPWSAIPSRLATGNFQGYGTTCSPVTCDHTGLGLGRFYDGYRCEDGKWLADASAIGPIATRQLLAPGIFTNTYLNSLPSLDPAASPIALGNGISVSTNGNGVTFLSGYSIFFSPTNASFIRFDFARPIIAWSINVANAAGDGLDVNTGTATYELANLQALNSGLSVPGSTIPGPLGVIERSPVSSITIRVGANDDDLTESWLLASTIQTVDAAGVCCRGATCAFVAAGQPCTGDNTAFVPAPQCNTSANATMPCCYADFNKTSGVNVNDIFVYLGAWFANNPIAKVGGDGVVTPTVADIFQFLGAWFAGC